MAVVLFDFIPCGNADCRRQNNLFWDGPEPEMPNVLKYVCPHCGQENRHKKFVKAYQTVSRAQDDWVELEVSD